MTAAVADAPSAMTAQPTLSELAVKLAVASSDSQGTTTFARTRPARLSVPTRFIGAGWFQAAVPQFESVMSLAPGWDSYGGVPTSLTSVEVAFQFLGSYLGPTSLPPSVVPLSDGGIQLVWHNNGVDVEATFSPTDDPAVYVHDVETGVEFDAQPFTREHRAVLREAFEKLRV